MVRCFIAALALAFVPGGVHADDSAPAAHIVPQGGIAAFEVVIQPGDSAPWGSYKAKPVLFGETEPRHYVGLVGIDMTSALETHLFEVKVIRGKQTVLLASIAIEVVDGKFGVQHLTLPKKMVDLDAPTLKRVRQEKSEVGDLWKSGTEQMLWTESWRMPVAGDPSGSFAKRRVINGEPRNPHNGEDIPAATGTPVHAPNAGIARLAKDRYFGGKTVFIEHGAGLFTFYMHLSKINVSDGQQIAPGDVIGEVGASGRATGPHLHWGGRLNDARVNPVRLTEITQPIRIGGAAGGE